MLHPRDHHQDGVHVFPAAEVVEVIILTEMSPGLWDRIPEEHDDPVWNLLHKSCPTAHEFLFGVACSLGKCIRLKQKNRNNENKKYPPNIPFIHLSPPYETAVLFLNLQYTLKISSQSDQSAISHVLAIKRAFLSKIKIQIGINLYIIGKRIDESWNKGHAVV